MMVGYDGTAGRAEGGDDAPVTGTGEKASRELLANVDDNSTISSNRSINSSSSSNKSTRAWMLATFAMVVGGATGAVYGGCFAATAHYAPRVFTGNATLIAAAGEVVPIVLPACFSPSTPCRMWARVCCEASGSRQPPQPLPVLACTWLASLSVSCWRM